MQIIIDISEELYNSVVDHDVAVQEIDPILDSILKGVVLPDKKSNDFIVVSSGKIIAGTENELYLYWLHKLSDIITYNTFVKQLKDIGTKILCPPARTAEINGISSQSEGNDKEDTNE